MTLHTFLAVYTGKVKTDLSPYAILYVSFYQKLGPIPTTLTSLKLLFPASSYFYIPLLGVWNCNNHLIIFAIKNRFCFKKSNGHAPINVNLKATSCPFEWAPRYSVPLSLFSFVPARVGWGSDE